MNSSLLEVACPCAADDDPLSGPANVVDRANGAALAQLTGRLSPVSIGAAFSDWANHLAISPGRQMHLAAKAARKITRLTDYARQVATGSSPIAPCIEPLPQDHRFDDPAWQGWPFNFIHQAFLLNQQWWDQACCSVGGVTQRHEDMVRFSVRQMRRTRKRRGALSNQPRRGRTARQASPGAPRRPPRRSR
jgi:polyhydroxyalkanoate synthase